MKTRLMNSKGEYRVRLQGSVCLCVLRPLVALWVTLSPALQGVVHCLTDTARLGPLAFYKVWRLLERHGLYTCLPVPCIFHSDQLTNRIAGSGSRRNPADPPHSSHLHLPRAATRPLWHPHRHVSTSCQLWPPGLLPMTQPACPQSASESPPRALGACSCNWKFQAENMEDKQWLR